MKWLTSILLPLLQNPLLLGYIGATGFRVGAGTVTATIGDVPHHLTLDDVLKAWALGQAGVPNSISSGVVTITYTPSAQSYTTQSSA